MSVQIQLRNGTASQWTSANPVLAAGEVGVETDTKKLKVGNGSTVWNSLTYISIAWQGVYSGSTQYYPNDIVTYSGSTYICTAASLGNLPTNASYWSILAAVGSGNVTGPVSSTIGNIPLFGTSNGAILIDGSKAAPAGVIVGTTDAQSLTNKTLVTPSLTNPTITNFTETRHTATVTANAITLDLTNGTFQTITTMAGANAITLPTPASGKSLTVQVVYASTPTTMTFSSPSGSLKYPGGTTPTPTLTNTKIDFYAFLSDGTNWYGTQSGANF
jgi:hypothetical protein